MKKGKVIGNYVLGRDLGKGTFGEVMVGTHSLTGEKVAIKVLEKENIKIEKEIVQLEDELDVIQDKSEKYKKQYEKEVSDIRNASDDKLVKLFTDTFENYEG